MTIEYRIFSPFMTLATMTAAALFALFFAGAPFMLGRTVEVSCSRTEQLCAASTRYPLFGASRVTRKLGELRPPSVSSPLSASDAGSIAFKTAFFPWYAADCARAEQCADAKTRLDAFFADPSMRETTATLRDPTAAWKGAAIAIVGGLFTIAFATRSLSLVQRAVVRLDPRTRTIDIERRRWLFRVSERRLDWSDVRAAAVREEMRPATVVGGAFTTRRVLAQFTTSFVLRNGERVDILERWSPSRGPHERVAEQINAVLAGRAMGASRA